MYQHNYICSPLSFHFPPHNTVHVLKLMPVHKSYHAVLRFRVKVQDIVTHVFTKPFLTALTLNMTIDWRVVIMLEALRIAFLVVGMPTLGNLQNYACFSCKHVGYSVERHTRDTKRQCGVSVLPPSDFLYYKIWRKLDYEMSRLKRACL